MSDFVSLCHLAGHVDRYGPAGPDGPAESCLLSDWPSDEIIPWKDTIAEPASEMYQRSSFGRGCELWRRAWPGAETARPTIKDQCESPNHSHSGFLNHKYKVMLF